MPPMLMPSLLMPSWGLPGTGARKTRLLALLAVRDGMRFLPGFLRNVAPQVDGIVALDDGSSDDSPELLARPRTPGQGRRQEEWQQRFSYEPLLQE